MSRIIENAVIDSISLKYEGSVLGLVDISYSESSQSFCSILSDIPIDRWMSRVMEIVGAKTFEDAKSKTIRVYHDNTKIYGIGHIVKDDWFYQDKDYSFYKGNFEDLLGIGLIRQKENIVKHHPKCTFLNIEFAPCDCGAINN